LELLLQPKSFAIKVVLRRSTPDLKHLLAFYISVNQRFSKANMKTAIISDTHDNLPNFKKVVDWIKKEKIKTIIHCGDACAPATLKEALKDFSGKVYFVFGNVDGDLFRITKLSYEGFPNLRVCGEMGELEIDGKKIAFCHFPKFAKGLANTQEYDLVFYGHTHKPWEEKIGKCRLVNPGNLSGFPYKATFAVYDTETDKLELEILEKLK